MSPALIAALERWIAARRKARRARLAWCKNATSETSTAAQVASDAEMEAHRALERAADAEVVEP